MCPYCKTDEVLLPTVMGGNRPRATCRRRIVAPSIASCIVQVAVIWNLVLVVSRVAGWTTLPTSFSLPTILIPRSSLQRNGFPHTTLSASKKDNNDNSSKNQKNKNLSSAERERRDEENRRKERKDDVVINRTSAKRGAQDYPLNPKATEEEWLRQASRVEQQVFKLTEEGMEALNSLQLDRANQAFDNVFALKPDAYLWQAGIVKFYLDDLVGAAGIFARNAKIFEDKRIVGPASEERIWRDACELKILSSMTPTKRKNLLKSDEGVSSIIPQIEDEEDDKDEDDEESALFSVTLESRKVFKLTRDLFSASVESNPSAEVLAKAQLRAIGGSFEDVIKMDRKMRKLTAWFYLGLHHDVMGEPEEAIKCMKMALQLSTSGGKSSDIVQTLPLLHMTARDWFDDDDFDEDPLKSDDEDGDNGDVSEQSSSLIPSRSRLLEEYHTDPVVEASIMEGVSKMTVVELKDSLRIRGLKTRGDKDELKERLFYSLMDDAGYQSGFAP